MCRCQSYANTMRCINFQSLLKRPLGESRLVDLSAVQSDSARHHMSAHTYSKRSNFVNLTRSTR